MGEPLSLVLLIIHSSSTTKRLIKKTHPGRVSKMERIVWESRLRSPD